MKVILINGSPHEQGCIFTALSEIKTELSKNGIDSEIFHVGQNPIRGCTACGECRKNGGICKYGDEDSVNEGIKKIIEADGVVVGSAVHFAAASGAITSFMDRVFYSNSGKFAFKPGASVVSCRRAGNLTAFDQLNKYFTIANMPVVPSQYWNCIYGNTAEEASKDLEGLQTMRTLAKNMAWMLKCFEAGKAAGVEFPKPEEEKLRTNFIR